MEAADGDTVSLLSPHSWEADIIASLLSLPQARLQVQPGSKSEHPSNFPQPEIFLKTCPTQFTYIPEPLSVNRYSQVIGLSPHCGLP